MKKIIVILFMLTACEQQSTTSNDSSTVHFDEPQVSVSQAVLPIDRTIKRIPLGDSRLIGELDEYWPIENEDDLLTQLIIANEEIALLPLTRMEVPTLRVNHDFIPEYAVGLKSVYEKYGPEDQVYSVLKTIWRTDGLHIVLAGTKTLENEGVRLAQRTDLLILKDNTIVDGVTVYYSFSEFSWGAYQLFYIDDNKQIWLQRFVNDEESIQTMESMSLAVLPNGKIRALSGVTGAQ